MANITLNVQYLINSATFNQYTVDDTTAVGAFQTTLATSWGTGIQNTWFTLNYAGTALNPANTLASYSIANNATILCGNNVDRLTTLQDRQDAKLLLAQIRKQAGGNTAAPYYRAYNTFDLDLLPTQYVGNTVVDNPGPLEPARPWQDL